MIILYDCPLNPEDSQAVTRSKGQLGRDKNVRKLVIIVSIIVAVMLQSTILSLWPWIGVKPDLVTVIVIITGLFYGLASGSMVGFIGGFLLDYSMGRLLGASAVSKMLVGGLSGWIAPRIFGDHLAVPPLAVLVGTWLEQSVYLLLANAFGSGLPVVESFWTIVLPVGLVNVVFSFPVYYYLLALDNLAGRGAQGEMDNKTRVERARILGWCIILMFSLLSGRLWYLQVVQGQKYAAMADGNRIRWVRAVAPRGRIFDRNGVPLATNRASFTVSLMPGSLDGETREHVLTRLSLLLGLTREELEDAITKGIRYPYEPIRVMQDVPAETVVALEEQRFELPGVMVEMEEVREYPQGPLASHVLGYMAPISPKLLSAWSSQGYYGSDYVGLTGLERLYEFVLRGEDGGNQVEVTALNRPVQILDRTLAIPGSDLILTIDRDLQAIAEEALTEQLAKVGLRQIHQYL